MRDRILETIVKPRGRRPVAFDALMPHRMRNILVVSSLYDSFTFEEDGRLSEMLFSEYLELNLRYAPNIERVSTAAEALEKLRRSQFDMVISMMRVGDMDVARLGTEVRRVAPGVPVILMAYNTRELTLLENMGQPPGIWRTFVWMGDARLFLAIIKSVEDRLNAWEDALTAGVPGILLIEDNIRFYSSYLPLLYTELVSQTQRLMSDGLNRKDKLIRMRARPKILLATTYEEGEKLFADYRDQLIGVVTDAAFPRNGRLDPDAGISFARMARESAPDRPVLIQSSVAANEARAEALECAFINKRSPSLLADLRQFMQAHLGFGDFTFRMPDGTVVGEARGLRSLEELIKTVPADALAAHAGRNDFSTWLMARSEYELAGEVRPITVSEFESIAALRDYLVELLRDHRSRTRAGVVTEFSHRTFEAGSGFARIGSGSLGGKGRGLAFANTLLEEFRVGEELEGVEVFVPPTAVLATGVFDEYMNASGLWPLVLGEVTDAEVAAAFQEAELPEAALESLRTLLERARYPLAVRSSSLLEDASYQPFAGVYLTCMIPNNHEDVEVRLAQLSRAIRLVYASTFFQNSKAYIDSTPNRLEEEKMAVVVQQVVGRQHEQVLYPDLAGVARSHDYYPMEGMVPEDGVASVVLGLGAAVVDGGRSVRFSPAHPRNLYQFANIEDTLNNAQRDFLALDLTAVPPADGAPDSGTSTLTRLDLGAAERHGTLHAVGSVYSPDNEAVYDGISRPGPRLVTLAGVLKAGVMPLAESLAFLLKVGTASFSCPVEMEFAVNLREGRGEPHRLAILQVRPSVIGVDAQDVEVDSVATEDAVCFTDKALGHGHIEGVRDVVYVPRASFDRSKTVEIAGEVGAVCARLRQEGLPFLLVGPGRWGSADRWLGIPVSWSQIAGVACIVETDMDDIRVAPSQGTHFFQNITSFGVGYFTVNFDGVTGALDQDWLDAQAAADTTAHTRHLRFAEPLDILVNGRRGFGAVMKPGRQVHGSEDGGPHVG